MNIIIKEYIYKILEVLIVIGMTLVNLIGIPILNLISWLVIAGVWASFMYKGNGFGIVRRVLECEILLLILSIFEALGGSLVDWLLNVLNINIINDTMRTCFIIGFSKLFIILNYS